MAEVTEIKVTVGGTINLGNYENVRREITLTAKVAPHESAEGAHKEINDIATYLLAKDVAEILKDQINTSYFENKDKDADYIRRHIENRQSFDYLKMISPAVAESLIEEYIAKYAAPEKPTEAAVEKSADAEIVDETPISKYIAEHSPTVGDPDFDDDYDLDDDDDLEDDYDEEDSNDDF